MSNVNTAIELSNVANAPLTQKPSQQGPAEQARVSVIATPPVSQPVQETERVSQDGSEAKAVDKSTIFDDIKANLEKLNQFIPVTSTNLVFEFDELGDPPVVKVVDRDSSEVIREIPSKEFREVAKALDNFADTVSTASGILFDKSV